MSVGTYCRGNLLLRCGLHSAGAVGSAAGGAEAPTDGGEGRGYIVAAARLQLVTIANDAISVSFRAHMSRS